MTPYPDWAEDLGHGIHAIDTGFQRPRFDAAYLMVHGGRAAYIDTGTNFAVPRLLALLDHLGLRREDVDHVIPTHVHLDHAGGVGALVRELPSATVWVHPRGARHLIDPSRLYAGALAVYGQDEMDRSYGQLLPVPAERVRETTDGTAIMLAGRLLEIAHTPGHAHHHHCIWDEATRGWFTGDTFGLSYRELDTAQGAWIVPTSTPVQFEPELLRVSVQRLLDRDPACMYLTHYGRVEGVARLGQRFMGLLENTVQRSRVLAGAPDRHAALCRMLTDLYVGSLQAMGHGADPAQLAEWLALDIELNAQGIAIWLDRVARQGQGEAARTAT
ncbi:MAG: MBL fold metallo-hydrolase [Burkholderiaceae bacterium]|nr:MBL fold metallo-hydrolase [Rhodoferax sp.]MCP5285281.1 MBL fold metallo-hydrolase [Burkholderiaceae bacterium]